MIRESDLRDLGELDPTRVAEAALAMRDSAARMVEYAAEAESAQKAFSDSFRSKRMPDVVARYVKPRRQALENVHTTAAGLFRVVETAWNGNGALERRRQELLESVGNLYDREIPPLLEEWMLATGRIRYPEVFEVPAAVALEEDALWEVAAFNRAVEEFAAEFERSLRALHQTVRERAAGPAGPAGVAVTAALVSAPLVSAAKLRAMTPAQVAAWWASLSAAARQRYVAAMPGVIGGLGGVDAASRSTANRAELARFATALKKIKPGDAGYDDARVKLQAIEAIQKKLGAHPEKLDPPLQLLLLDLSGKSPKAAISVGDLDTADHVTFNIPGMMTTVAKDMNGWTDASMNLYTAQQNLSRESGASEKLAVVAWLGYDAPQDFWGENGNDAAKAGGTALAGALKGTLAARGWPAQSERLSVVGFSYGSAVAGVALKSASAGSFVSVGSAGIPGEVAGRTPYRAHLNVPEGGISAGQARGDAIAHLGKLGSGRSDPASYGAVPFSTDGAHTPDGTVTAGTTDHAATVRASDPGKYGYYDQGTTSLHNMAAYTLGYPGAAAK